MIATSFRAMGTAWWIHCDRPDLLASAETLVSDLEDRLSRFKPSSTLSRLNRERQVTCPVLGAVTRRALEIQVATDGAFDPALGAELAALGYDRSFEHLGRRSRLAERARAPGTPTRALVDGDHIHLEGPGSLDLGGIAKGFAVDRVVDHLVDAGATSVLVDGGGDIRGCGPSFPIGVGDGLVVWSHLGAVATSSTRKRRWFDPGDHPAHHLIDPVTRRSSDGPLDTATVIAPDAATADALATALIVATEAVLARLPDFGAHALVRGRDGHWWATARAPFTAPLTPIFDASCEESP